MWLKLTATDGVKNLYINMNQVRHFELSSKGDRTFITYEDGCYRAVCETPEEILAAINSH